MDEEKVTRLEQLICDLIKQNARSHVKLNSYDEQIRQLQQQIVMLEQFVYALRENDNNDLFMIS